jgi:hypothetical protein
VNEACLLIRCLAMEVLFLRALAQAEMCLPSRCLAIDVLFLRELAQAEMCLPSRWLGMGIHFTILTILIKHVIKNCYSVLVIENFR